MDTEKEREITWKFYGFVILFAVMIGTIFPGIGLFMTVVSSFIFACVIAYIMFYLEDKKDEQKKNGGVK